MEYHHMRQDARLNKTHYINFERIAVSGLLFSSLIVYFFIGLMNSVAPFAVLVCLFTLLYLFSKPLALKSTYGIKPVWFLALMAMVIAFANNASIAIGNSVDLVVMVCCVIFICNPPKTTGIFSGAMKLLVVFAVFYAVSIWIQILLPGVYAVFLGAMKNGSENRVQEYTSYYTGFTTNPGHTSQYIIAGILAIISHGVKKKQWLLILFLFFSLLFTGKRADVVAVILILLVYYLNQAPSNKTKRMIYVFMALPVLFMLLLVLEPFISRIPAVSRIIGSIVGILNGEEIASDRTNLASFAKTLFRDNPILGIGWGNFKENVVGNVTYRIKFDVHNIYLQLLCECGIVGFVLFMIPAIATLIHTKKYLNLLTHSTPSRWLGLISFSWMYQLFFLILGFLDNTLYNLHTLVCYLFCCMITSAFARSRWKHNLEHPNPENDEVTRDLKEIQQNL